MKYITLTNGKIVGNFSSPHNFTFTDGSILPAVTEEKSIKLQVTFIEVIDNDGDVTLDFDLSKDVLKEIAVWELWKDMGVIDIVFCPLPMIKALYKRHYDVKATPFRTIRMEDRIKKLVSIEKQCL